MTTTLPAWLKKKVPDPHVTQKTQKFLERLQLHTICESGRCLNAGKCYSNRTATFLILGDICTRHCTFCAVNKGTPEPVDPKEIQNIMKAAEWLGLRYVVITSVTRDDLTDGGASHFVKVIDSLHFQPKRILVEALIPDFRNTPEGLEILVSSEPEVINHSIETVSRLYSKVRPRASYKGTLQLLHRVKCLNPNSITKSGLMVGLGETENELIATMQHLREVDCDLLTIGQYLAPSKRHHPVVEFVAPEKFQEYAAIARELGFSGVASAPLVRSSFLACDLYIKAKKMERV